MAYAALVSLLQTTERMLNFDPYFVPCSKERIRSFRETIDSLICFLDNCSPSTNSSPAMNDLVTKIRDAAYEAEDVFESIISNHIRGNSGSNEYGSFQVSPLSMEKAMEKIDSIKKEVNKIEDGSDGMIERRIPTLGASSRSAAKWETGTKTIFVALNNNLMMEIMEQLAGERPKLEIIPIIGMGGSGKTTLARTLFNSQLIMESFEIRAWVTISQEYSVHDIVCRLLSEVGVVITKENNQSKREDIELRLYQFLCGRKYLIVLDDVWNNQAWDDMRMLFPDNNNGSRIMLTTRQSKVASYANSGRPYHELKLLNEDESWCLLCQQLFEQQNCPSELVEIGKKIAKNCQGLPLAISVIGGLLSVENMTKEYWTYVAENLNSVLMTNDDQCLDILSLSYNYLPHYLKACFLYFGLFPEDYEIRVSTLIELWFAEGFQNLVSFKSMEELAKEYLTDLIDRNLILVHEYGSYGKPKTCGIHDLLRDICIWESQKEKFLHVLNRKALFHPAEANNQRRLSIYNPDAASKYGIEDPYEVARSMSYIRSFICRYPSNSVLRFGSPLVKVLDVQRQFKQFPEEILELVNLRYLVLDFIDQIPSSISRLWNLQTFKAHYSKIFKPFQFEFWEMPQLRHIRFKYFSLPDAEYRGTKSQVLNNLQTLSGAMNLRCTEEVLTRIPNLRKLGVTYRRFDRTLDWSNYCLNNLVNLCELESLSLDFWMVSNETCMQDLAFPSTLKKLVLQGCRIPWKHLKIFGLLPNLEVLKLKYKACKGPVWKPNEEEFKNLKFLLIEKPDGLVEWIAENIHFPRLQHLIVRKCYNLEAIPFGIGEIPTLKIVELYKCSHAADSSAKEIFAEDDYIKLVIHPKEESDDDSSLSDCVSGDDTDSDDDASIDETDANDNAEDNIAEDLLRSMRSSTVH